MVVNLTHLGRGNLSRGIGPSDWPMGTSVRAFSQLLVDGREPKPVWVLPFLGCIRKVTECDPRSELVHTFGKQPVAMVSASVPTS